MSSAVFAIAVNAAVACLFAATYLVIGLSNPSFRRVLWFALAYAIGMGTPVSELLVRFSDYPQMFAATSSATFLLAFLTTAVGIATFYRQRIPWLALAAILAGSVALRAAIWGGPRNTLPYELFYQLPFVAATALCAVLVFRARDRQDWVLGALFLMVSAHFLVKPLVAVTFGSGPTAKAYADSAYALFSQSSSGILLVAVGLALVVAVLRKMLGEAQQASEVDPLSGLLNRRGFIRRSDAAIARAASSRGEVALMMLDLDHFKQINDTHGHSVGDRVIVAFARILMDCCPPKAIVGRIGGEEFAILLENSSATIARLLGETIRAHLNCRALDETVRIHATVSIGLALGDGSTGLSDLAQRADDALYDAKRGGRDRLCIAPPAVVTLQTAGRALRAAPSGRDLADR
jgi:diguanylate cyclase (GGDEF)-like protein